MKRWKELAQERIKKRCEILQARSRYIQRRDKEALTKLLNSTSYDEGKKEGQNHKEILKKVFYMWKQAEILSRKKKNSEFSTSVLFPVPVQAINLEFINRASKSKPRINNLEFVPLPFSLNILKKNNTIEFSRSKHNLDKRAAFTSPKQPIENIAIPTLFNSEEMKQREGSRDMKINWPSFIEDPQQYQLSKRIVLNDEIEDPQRHQCLKRNYEIGDDSIIKVNPDLKEGSKLKLAEEILQFISDFLITTP
jgi:hypothetical protein